MIPEVAIIVLIIAIPTYFICKNVMKTLEIGNEHSRKLFSIIPTIIFSPIIYVGIIMIWISSNSYYSTNDFNQNEWHSNKEERYKMSKNLIKSEMLIRKTQEEVFQLLGTGLLSNNERRISYELGFVPGLFNIDPDYLEIILEDGVVVSVNQYGG